MYFVHQLVKRYRSACKAFSYQFETSNLVFFFSQVLHQYFPEENL